MSLRVSKITLGKDCPVGAFELTGLDTADLVLIVGPNGAGKSSLLAPLKTSGKAGRASVHDTSDPQRVERDFSTKGTLGSISFVTSQDLMAEVRSLDGALALAADTSRHRVAVRILDACIAALNTDQHNEAVPPADGPEFHDLSTAFLAADRECGQMPRTVESYDARGRSLAQAKGAPWSGFDRDPNTGPQAEHKLIPELRGMAGALAAIAALSDVARLMPVESDGPAQQAERARTAYSESLASAQRELQLGPETTHEDVLTRLNKAVVSTSELIAAADHLLACRKSAREFLGPTAARSERCDCPVCNQPIDASAVTNTLDEFIGCGQVDVNPQLHDALKRWEGLTADLKTKHKDWSEARKRAASAITKRRTTLVDARVGLTPANEWHDELKAMVGPVTEAIEAWLRKYPDAEAIETWLRTHTDADTIEAETVVHALSDRARDTLHAVETRDKQMRNALAPLQESFKEFQALGRALRLRHRLNALQHIVDLDAQEAAATRTARRALWQKALEAVRNGQAVKVAEAREQVLEAPQIRERFTRLMERFHGVDPWLANLKYDGKPLADDLSEGQTVLVNLAAALTVASVAIGTPGHAPGWVVLDEPTNALDQHAVTQLAQYLGSLSNDDLPGQLFVATFDEGFANALREGSRRAGRRVRQVTLGHFDRAQPQRRLTMMTDATFDPAPNQGPRP